MTEINPKIAEYFHNRGISETTLIGMGVYSGKRQATGDGANAIIPAEDGNIIVFPFIVNGIEAGAKYRTADKRFWSKAGCKKQFYNSDVLDDQKLHSGEAPLLIVEGEIDCLTAVQYHPWTVSVPNGAGGVANQGKIPDDTRDIDPDKDDAFSFIFDNWERLKKIKRIIIGVDSDEPGRRLAAELVRRLGRVRCSYLVYPDGMKDLNEVCVSLGAEALIACINNAKPYPVSGVYSYFDLPEEAKYEMVSTGWRQLDNNLKLYFPALMVVTGFANAGKSSWVNQMVAQVARDYGWHIAIASFEMRLRPYVTEHIKTVFDGLTQYERSEIEEERADYFVNQHFTFIAPEPGDDGADETADVDWLIERAEAAVIRRGARAIVIDPWNEVEHSRMRDESVTEYTGRAIKKLKAFARRMDVLVIVVAHPTKHAKDKAFSEISLYDIADSAHWANKPDMGVVIARVMGDEQSPDTTEVLIRKVRYQPEAGRIGNVQMSFDVRSGTFV